MRTIFLLGLLCCSSPALAETDVDSGNYMLPACKELVNMGRNLVVWQGQCGGVISGLMWVGRILPPERRFCFPNGATNQQAERIAVKYMEDHPERLQEDFRRLALDALHQAWPCN